MSMATRRKISHRGLAALAGLMLASGLALAHPQPDETVEYSAAELEELVGPIALYPDDLLGVMLRATMFPLQIVQAARFLEELAEDPELEPPESWDDSVVALLNYPEVIELLNEDLDWTASLGAAITDHEPDVLEAIQQFRERALSAGNLRSDDLQAVRVEDGVIEIESIVQDVLYVPEYEPAQVVIYQNSPVYRYHAFARPVHYYPYPARYHFPSHYFWGVTTHYGIGWLDHGLYAHRLRDHGHPYYRHDYAFHHHYYRGRHYDERDDELLLGGNQRPGHGDHVRDQATPARDRPETTIRPNKSFRKKDPGPVSRGGKARARRGSTATEPNAKVTYHRGTYGNSTRLRPKQNSVQVISPKGTSAKTATVNQSSSAALGAKRRSVAKKQRSTSNSRSVSTKRSVANTRSATTARSTPSKLVGNTASRVTRAPSRTTSSRSSPPVKVSRSAAPTRQASSRSVTRSPNRSSSVTRSGSSRGAVRGSRR